jgi:hypothetical protein
MCMHTSHQPYGYPPLTLCSWQWTHWNPWCNLQHFWCHWAKCWFPRGTRTITCASFNHIQLFSSMSWHFIYQRWHSHFNQHCHCQPNASGFTSPILHNLRICYLWCISSQLRKGAITTNTAPINSSLYQLKYLVAYTNMSMCFYMIVPMPFGAWKGQKALIFLPWPLFFVKNFQSHHKRCKCLPS